MGRSRDPHGTPGRTGVSYNSRVNLTVNGQATDAREGQTVRELIDQLKLGDRAVAVEVNKKLIPRRLHEATRLQPGDVVELVTLVGGG